MLENAIASAPSRAQMRTFRSEASHRSIDGSVEPESRYSPVGAPTAWKPPSTCTISPEIARA
jgi:hypothetical protein